MSKIVRLTAENVKRLRAVEIAPDGNVVIVGGRNGQGKTSLLDSIHMALGGKGAQCEEPVRRGASKAGIICELDGLIVKRTISKKGGSSLTVMAPNGEKIGSPQRVLDRLASTLTFDPLDFLRMKPVKQFETVRELVGVDLTEIEAARKEAFDKRTNVNRELKSEMARLDGMAWYDDVEEGIDIAELMDELNRADRHNQEAARVQETIREIDTNIRRAKSDILRFKQQLEQAERKLKKFQAEREGAEELDQIDTAEIKELIASAQAVNQKHTDNQQYAAVEERAEELAEESKQLTRDIEGCERQKTEAIETAEFPIEGMSFCDDQLLFNELPFEQASSAEQLKVSVAMGIAMNPELRVLLIRDGSLLDDDSLATIAEMAEENDAQVWIERVGEGEECSVIIEDGSIKED